MPTAPSSSEPPSPASPVEPLVRLRNEYATLVPAMAMTGRDQDETEVVTEMLRQVTRFCEHDVDVDWIAREHRLPPETLAAARRLGLFGITIPAEHDGGGLSMKGSAEIVAALAAHDGSTATTIGLHCGLGLRGLVAFGSDALHRTYLPRIARGELIAAFGATEPEAGSDLSAIRTKAVQDGDHLVLNGTKCFLTNGGFKGPVTVLVFTPGLGGFRQGHSLLLVDLTSPGVSISSEWNKLGLRGSSTVDVSFEDVRVPLDHVIGTPGKGMEHAHTALSWGRTFLASGCLGTARGALRQALEHTAIRKQFNRPLQKFELVRARLIEMDARVHAMHNVIRLVTELEGRAPGSIRWESAIAKVLCSEQGWQVVDDALQLHGGLGYMESIGLARRLRDVRVTRIFEGANEVLRLHIASAALTWRRADLKESSEPIASGTAAGPLVPVKAAYDDAWRVSVETILRVRAKFGARIHRRQVVQVHLAELLIWSFTAFATLLRAEGELARTVSAEAEEQALARCRVTCRWCCDGMRESIRLLEQDLEGGEDLLSIGACLVPDSSQ